jgi:hypothetical protein
LYGKKRKRFLRKKTDKKQEKKREKKEKKALNLLEEYLDNAGLAI